MTAPSTAKRRCPNCNSDVLAAAAFCTGCGRPLKSDPDPWSGKMLLGKYRSVERIGVGLTSFVYKVQHVKLLHFRAMKLAISSRTISS